MIQLTLVRHAAAEAGAFGQPDADRALSSRGERDAPEMARRALREGVRPTVILTSSARRARATAHAFAEAMGAEVTAHDDLYAATAEDILTTTRQHGQDEVLVVSHDPGISALASSLAGQEVRMAPGAVAIFTWDDATWDAADALAPDDVSLLTPA